MKQVTQASCKTQLGLESTDFLLFINTTYDSVQISMYKDVVGEIYHTLPPHEVLCLCYCWYEFCRNMQ
jgi:hypothetical protein